MQHAENGAGPAQHQALGEQRAAQRAVARAQRRAHGQLALAANRARQDQVRDVRAGDDEDDGGGGEQHEQDRPRRRGNLIAQRRHGQLHVGSRRVGLGVLARPSPRSAAVSSARASSTDGLRRQPAEELGHPMHALDVHRRAHVVRAGHHVGDDLGVGGVRHRRLEDADDRRRPRAEVASACRSPPGSLLKKLVQKRCVRTTAPAALWAVVRGVRAAGPAPAAGPSPRSTTRRRRRRATGAARRSRAS